MQPAGSEIIAKWRETGEWWSFEPCREIVRTLTGQGHRREDIRIKRSLYMPRNQTAPEPYKEDLTVDWDLRIKKVRDEKVAKACGLVQAPKLPKTKATSRPYAALQVQSGYSFGRSSILAEEIAAYAADLAIPAVLIADHFSLAGAWEFALMARQLGIKPMIGASIELAEGGAVILIARDPLGYRSLSRLITECHLHEPRLYPLANWDRLQRHSEGLLCLSGGNSGPIDRLLMGRRTASAQRIAERLIDIYGRANVRIEIERTMQPWSLQVEARLRELSQYLRLKMVAGGTVQYAKRQHFAAQDVLCCVDTLCRIDEVIGRRPQRTNEQPELIPAPMRGINAERFLRSPAEFCEIYADSPDLVAETMDIADQCADHVLPGPAILPTVTDDDAHALVLASWAGARLHYPKISRPIRNRIETELAQVVRLGYATHFMIASDMCQWAQKQNIVFSARGSAVDSILTFCLGLTPIDAHRHQLHFSRFLPSDGTKRPDIDIDFEAHRREDVRQYLVEKYGKDRVATVAAFGAYCTRGIIREVGKVMGLPDATIGFLSKRIHGGVPADKLESALENRPELRASDIPKERFEWVFRLARSLMDIPRNIRAHSSGVIVSALPIADYVPIQPSGVDCVRIIQWDKRSAKKCFDKFDILCLRGNDVLSGAQSRIRETTGDFSFREVPVDDPETYRAMRTGELIGIPQSASPAMRQAHTRIRTQNLNDASLVQAGIRPGVGGAVKINELIARRRFEKAYSFLHPELERILGSTYGIIVFQEQVDQLLQTFGGYTPGEAEEIREAIHKRRREDYVATIKERVIGKIIANGYTPLVAQEVYDLVAVFQGYGFAQGHALAFAEISVRSIWCQQNYPAEYFASLLDAQPAGYYGPCTLANEARFRGVQFLPVCVNNSAAQFTVESRKVNDLIVPSACIRIGLKQIAELSQETRARIVAYKPYRDFFHFACLARPNRDELQTLVLCGALDVFHPNRREMLWAIPRALEYAKAYENSKKSHDILPISMPIPPIPEGVSDFNDAERAIYERAILGMDIQNHLMAFERDRITARGGITAREIQSMKGGDEVFVVGNPIRLRFPPTASGKRVVFFDLEDETGLLNVTCFDKTYQKDGHAIICSQYVTVRGRVQIREDHVAFLAERVYPYRPKLLDAVSTAAALPIGMADFLVG